MDANSVAGRRFTVLLVEDEPLILAMMTDMLEMAGFEVIAVSAAEDALGFAFMDAQFDLLFTDINLAGLMDGWELAVSLRDMQPDLPVVYASAGAPSAAARVADSIFVSKPYDPRKVAALVERQAELARSAVAASSAAAAEPARPELRQSA